MGPFYAVGCTRQGALYHSEICTVIQATETVLPGSGYCIFHLRRCRMGVSRCRRVSNCRGLSERSGCFGRWAVTRPARSGSVVADEMANGNGPHNQQLLLTPREIAAQGFAMIRRPAFG